MIIARYPLKVPSGLPPSISEDIPGEQEQRVCLQNSSENKDKKEDQIMLSNTNMSLTKNTVNSWKIIYPRICERCKRLYKTRNSFSYHKKTCNIKINKTSIYPRICEACNKLYSCKQSYFGHKKHCTAKSVVPAADSLKTCEICHGVFSDLKTYLVHEKSCNNSNISHFSCTFSDCNRSFLQIKALHKHVLNEHKSYGIQNLTFHSMSLFNKWLESESAATFTYFRKFTGSKAFNSKLYHYYGCQFSSKQVNPSSVTSRRNKKGTFPKDINCPVRLWVSESTDSVNVSYFSKHNHPLNFENCKYQPLKLSTRNMIKACLSLSIPISKIREILQDGAKNQSGALLPVKEAFLTNKQISSYKYKKHTYNSQFPVSDATMYITSYVDRFRRKECTTKFENISGDDFSMENNSDAVVDVLNSCYEADNSENKVAACEQLALELVELLKNLQVQSVMLNDVHSTLDSLVSECRGVMSCNKEHIQTNNTLVNSAAPNQKLVPQPNLSQNNKNKLPPECGQDILLNIENSHSAKQHKLDSEKELKLTSSPITDQSVMMPLNNATNLSNSISFSETPESFTSALNDFNDIFKPIVMVNNHEINMLDLKSLDPNISETEESSLALYSSSFKRGRLYDTVIDSYLGKLVQDTEDVHLVESPIAYSVFYNLSEELWLPQTIQSIKYLFIPLCIDNHWIFLVVGLKDKIFYIYDSHMNSFNDSYTDGILNFAKLLSNIFDVNVWDIQTPPHCLQSDTISCGVFVCFYAYKLLHDGNTADIFDTLKFRKHIYDTLINDNIALF